ncbi:hypothetical protein CIK05_05645 [Bdellovibrio sp. qaytius]|nr:hypothetical protein CIK05_05645 [Bdellovibrio sp. qaytius]
MKQVLMYVILFSSVQIWAQSFEAGLWKSKESLELNGIPLPSSSDEECITKEQAKDAKATIEKELKKKGCTLTKWNYKNQNLDAAITCNNKDMVASGKLTGPFTSKSYKLTCEATGTYKDVLPAVAELKLSGERVSACSK